MAEADLNTQIARMAHIVETYGRPDTHLNESEVDWITYDTAPDMLWKPLRFEMSLGRATTLSKVKKPMTLGRHRHDGTVMVFTIAGTWHYEEYDWVATAGSVICEAPGAIHTLKADSSDLYFLSIFDGASEHFGDDGGFTGIQTIFHFVDEYVANCEKLGVPVNRKLFD